MYYYKDEVHQDSVVSVAAMKKMFEELGTSSSMKRAVDLPNAGNHEYAFKMINSAMITAEKYHRMGKDVGFLKLFFAPAFSFIKTYILKGGFRDGYKGWLIAKTTAYYTFIKYARLKELNGQ